MAAEGRGRGVDWGTIRLGGSDLQVLRGRARPGYGKAGGGEAATAQAGAARARDKRTAGAAAVPYLHAPHQGGGGTQPASSSVCLGPGAPGQTV